MFLVGGSFEGEQVEKFLDGRFEKFEIQIWKKFELQLWKNLSDGSPNTHTPGGMVVNPGLSDTPGSIRQHSAGHRAQHSAGHVASYTPPRMRVRWCIVSAVTVS